MHIVKRFKFVISHQKYVAIDFVWVIGGPQGGGIDTGANLFMRAVSRAGYYIFGDREYFSNIKGRHSYFMVRISDEPKRSLLSSIDVLVALDAETVFTHFNDVKDNGYLILDLSIMGTRLDQLQFMEHELKERLEEFFRTHGMEPTVKSLVDTLRSRGVDVVGVQFNQILQEVRRRIQDVDLPSLVSRFSNTVMTAISLSVMGLPMEYLLEALSDVFAGRRGQLLEYNKIIVETSYEYMRGFKSRIKLEPLPKFNKRFLVNGNEAVAIGKMLGGLRFQSYYPITPAADEAFYIESHENVDLEPITEEAKVLERVGIVVVQTEDEIAAITMASGAAIAGARAATSTSGPGLSLMVEGVGFAGMNEIPVVITHYQRGGPSTGLPTRNSQSDLRFVMHMGHGEFPRIVVASGDHEEALEDALKALNWAERYQIPVIHLVEKAIANSYTLISPSLNLKIDRGYLVTSDIDDYRRFRITDNGVSPRSIPGLGPVFWLTGDEHDEYGHITEDPEMRREMYEKRMRKLDLASKEIPLEDKVKLHGPEDAEVTIVGWGSSKGAILDAMARLKSEGLRVNFLQLRMFIPFPSDYVRRILGKGQLLIDVESNYEAQAAGVIREKTGIEIKHKVLKWTGRPIMEDEVYDAIKRILKTGEERIVLTKGP